MSSYRCFIPECEDKNSTNFLPTWLEYTVPMFGNQTPSECEKYETDTIDNECSEIKFLKNQTIECDQWIFKDDENTIVKEVSLKFKFYSKIRGQPI